MDDWYESCCSDGQDYVRWGELDEWYEPGSLEEYNYIVQLGKDYAQWFETFTGTARGDAIVREYNRDWRKMHNELFVFYRHEMLLESYDDEEVYPLQEIDVSQRDNFKWQFRAWMIGIQDTCPNPKLYFGRYYGLIEELRYKRFFFKHHWNPEKTVDDHWNPEKIESLMKKS